MSEVSCSSSSCLTPPGGRPGPHRSPPEINSFRDIFAGGGRTQLMQKAMLTWRKALRWATECLEAPEDLTTRTPGTLSTSSSLSSSSCSSSENERRPSVFTRLVVMWPLAWLLLPRWADEEEEVWGASSSSISHSISSSPPSSSMLTWGQEVFRSLWEIRHRCRSKPNILQHAVTWTGRSSSIDPPWSIYRRLGFPSCSSWRPSGSPALCEEARDATRWPKQSRNKTVSFPAWLRCSWPHLLSRLWSSSPSRQAVSPTNRTVSTTPSAWLRLDRVTSLSSEDDFSSMVLWGNKGGRSHSSLILAVRAFSCKKGVKRFLTWAHTQLRCTT